MKCVIFGGGGFIGSAIADRLLRDGHALRIFERPRVEPYRKFSEGEQVEWMTGDLQSAHDVGVAVEGADIVLHLVSSTLPKSSNDDPIYDVQSNLIATLQMLDVMVAKNVCRIIFISSGGTVYGPPETLPIDENHRTEPQISYGIVKLAIEKYLLMYERIHGIRSIILRVANPFGERQRVATAQGAVGVFLHHALIGKPIEVWGDGETIRDYIYISDVADAFAAAVRYAGPKSVFNVSSGVGLSLNGLIASIESVLGRHVIREYLPARLVDVPVSILCNRLALKEMGWTPKVTFFEGLGRTADWMATEIAK
ncbi:NAD-dependent epimerase/dehydratase family protein [Rhodanobacter denitrificans]|uniref:NAD-dependent epimerase/dehydratase family protein n=1 Tax=Rhodanobacter denitrificans TaxID=666685 RepID=UPI001226C5C9|nr:NAD-dependent epimerase/dehydratase family protein [Rhodanobacter denitrificans]TAM60801.1 MAG: NAD-dependent epimerase/dehydratase family protein [Rhodanobacter sp.]UJJ59570.1 NAD-dependent epimerase/dehydratase family protein [Rhodanobacter denitrificans]